MNIDPQLIVVGLAALSPFILYGIYVMLRGSGSSAAARRNARAEPAAGGKTRVEPVIGSRETGAAPAQGMNFDDHAELAVASDEGAAEVDVIAKQLDSLADGEVVADDAFYTDPEPEPEASQSETQSFGQERDRTPDDESEPPPAASAAPEEQQLHEPVREPKAESGRSDEEFPGFGSEKLNEIYHYVVRVTADGSFHSSLIMKISQRLAETGLQMYQVLLGHDANTGRWERPRADKSYRHLLWAVPLCNRSGRISSDNMALIVRVFQDAMRKHKGVAQFPSHSELEERLEAVDEFCSHVDHRVSIHLVANRADGGQPQRVGDIIDLAKAEGLEEREGELLRIVNGEVVYKLCSHSGDPLGDKSPDRKMAGLILELDLPHVSNTLEAFDEMVAFAGKLSRVLRFRQVDENHEEIDAESMAEIRIEVDEMCKYMHEMDVLPGSRLARALFK